MKFKDLLSVERLVVMVMLLAVLYVLSFELTSPYITMDKQGVELNCAEVIDKMNTGKMSVGSYYLGLTDGSVPIPQTPAHYEKANDYQFKSCRAEFDKLTVKWCTDKLNNSNKTYDRTQGMCDHVAQDYFAEFEDQHLEVINGRVKIGKEWVGLINATIQEPIKFKYAGVDLYKVCVSGGIVQCSIRKTKESAHALFDTLINEGM